METRGYLFSFFFFSRNFRRLCRIPFFSLVTIVQRRCDSSDSARRSSPRKRGDLAGRKGRASIACQPQAGQGEGGGGRKRLQPRKVPIQSNDVPFNLYAKRSIEHIVILIDRIHSVQYWGHWQFDYTRSLPISGLESNPSKIYPRHPLPSYLSISLSLQ